VLVRVRRPKRGRRDVAADGSYNAAARAGLVTGGFPSGIGRFPDGGNPIRKGGSRYT
jgi:hypothetical protein